MQSGAKNVCKRPVAPEGALQPLLTVVVRTDKLNGQVRLARRLAFHCSTLRAVKVHPCHVAF